MITIIPTNAPNVVIRTAFPKITFMNPMKIFGVRAETKNNSLIEIQS